MKALSSWIPTTAVVVVVIVVGVYLAALSNGSQTTTVTQQSSSSSSATSSVIQGVVTGYVTAGPAKPVCSVNQSCDENMSGYSIVFTPQCPGSAGSCQAVTAPLSYAGHYSILLPPGAYTVTGLSPACKWMGCSTAFPKIVTVEGGMQLVFNVQIDTGIR
jgi:hypothetical protein